MEWSKRMNAAIDYFEDNLAGEIDFSEAAKKAFCSLFHFQRMFLAVIGYTPAEYVRRRRLTLAAKDLALADSRVIDIAMKYGYDSPDSFTRAFRNAHGITPQVARIPGASLTAFPRISFTIILKGGSDMDYRIIEKQAFNAAAVKRPFTLTNGRNFIEVPKFWDEFLKSDDCARLTALTEGKSGAVTGGEMLGICFGDDKETDFYYGIAVELPQNAESGEFEKVEIPSSTWAVFDCSLPTLRDVTKRIFSEWFPSTGYEHAPKPELEVYFAPDPVTNVMPVQIWVPVIKNPKK